VSGSDVLGPHLDDARALLGGGREQGPETKIVSEYHVTVGVGHAMISASAARGRRRSTNGLLGTRDAEEPLPTQGEVHVDHYLHGTDNGTSISSARHAA